MRREARVHPFIIDPGPSYIVSMRTTHYAMALLLACAVKLTVQGGCVGRFGRGSAVNNHVVKIVSCVQRSTSLIDGLCLRLPCCVSGCHCLCMSCGAACLCEHDLPLFKSSGPLDGSYRASEQAEDMVVLLILQWLWSIWKKALVVLSCQRPPITVPP
jgi:hypothetical protein